MYKADKHGDLILLDAKKFAESDKDELEDEG